MAYVLVYGPVYNRTDTDQTSNSTVSVPASNKNYAHNGTLEDNARPHFSSAGGLNSARMASMDEFGPLTTNPKRTRITQGKR